MQSRMRNRTTPIDALVAVMVSKFDDNLREDFEERAGIIEFEAMVPRAHAECLALIDVLRRRPDVLAHVAPVETDPGDTQS